MRLFIFILLTPVWLFARQEEPKYLSGELFVKVSNASDRSLPVFEGVSKKEADIEDGLQKIINNYRITSIQKASRLPDPALQKTYRVIFEDTAKADQLIKELENLSYIEYAEKVPLYELFLTPNDKHANQWYLDKIQAEQAWDISTGSNTIKVAVVDNAVSTTHEDLTPNLWINTGETAGNGIDDDGNGYIDDINGFDLADNDNNPNPPYPSNSSWAHGTHCAGLAAAATNNNTGIAGVSFNVKYIAVKCTPDASSGNYLTATFQGVEYAIIAGADIISMSYGGSGYSQTYQNLFNYANSIGIVCIAAAGNSNISVPMYPAAYNNVISVAASDDQDNKASFSNYGSWIDVTAPGVGMYSTLAGSNSSYGNKSGTSMACPLTAGLAALMLSFDPSLTPNDLENCLKSSCDNIDAQNPSYIGLLGAGRINAFQALQCLGAVVADFEADYARICPGASVNFSDLSYNATSWQWSFPGGTPSSSTQQNPTVTYSSAGSYDVTLIVTDGTSADTLTRTAYIEVALPEAVLSGNATIPSGSSAYLRVDLQGRPPWGITYTDGVNSYTVNNITSTPHFIQVSPAQTTTYTLTGMNDADCAGNTSGSATVTVTGISDNPCCSDTLGAGWAEATDAASWEVRTELAATVFDNKIWVIGGTDGNAFNDVWSSTDGINWTETVAAAPWIARSAHVAIEFNNKFWIFGGSSGAGVGRNDIWSSTDGINWIQETSSASWSSRYGHTIVEFNNMLWLMGGRNGNTFYNDVWNSIDGVNWTLVNSNSSWNRRQGHNSVTLNNKIWVFGGRDLNNNFLNDIWSSTDGTSWVNEGNASWEARWNATTLVKDGVIFIFGGSNSNYFNDTWKSNDGSNWLLVKGNNCWGKRKSHSSVLFDNKFWIIGGDSSAVYKNDVWESELCSSSPCSQSTFQKTYGSSGNEGGHTVITTSDGGLAVVGYTNSSGAGGDDIFVLKTDANGNEQWSRTYGGSADEEGFSLSIKQISDGGYIVTGATSSFGAGGRVVYIIRIDASGNVLWEKRIGNGSGAGDSGRSIIETSDGSFIITGTTHSYGAGTSEGYILKLSSNGNVLWTKTIGGTAEDHFTGIQETFDGNYIIVGMTRTYGAGSGSAIAVKIDPSGNILWNKVYYTSQFDNFTKVEETTDNGYLFTGFIRNSSGVENVLLIKTDSSGNLQWSKTYGGTADERGYNTRQTADGGFIISGFTESFGFGSRDNLIIKTDASGNVEWSKTFGSSGYESGDSWADGIAIAADGGFVFTGVTNGFGAAGEDVTLVKLDACGNGCGNLQDVTLTVTTPTFSVTSPTPSESSGGTLTNTTTQVSPTAWSDSTLCEEIAPSSPCSGSQTTFQRTYGGANTDGAQTIFPADDGGFYLLGRTNSFGAGDEDAYLIKINAQGDEEWSKTYGGTAKDWGWTMQQLGADTLLLGGYTESFSNGSYDRYFVATDESGNELWSKNLGGSNNEYVRHLLTLDDNTFLAAGYTNTFGTGGNNFYLTKHNKNGNLIWSKTYGTSSNDFPYQVLEQDNKYLITGYQAASDFKGLLVQTDTAGNVLWSKFFDASGNEHFIRSVLSPDGNYVHVGYTTSFGAGGEDFLVVKTDTAGNIIWQKAYGGTANDKAFAVVNSVDEGHIIVGHTESFGNGQTDIYAVKIDAAGNEQWSKTYGTSGNETFLSTGAKITASADEGYAILAVTDNSGAGGNDFLVIKIDCQGNSGCNETDPNTVVTDISLTITDVTLAISSGGTINNAATVTNTAATLDSTLCEDIISPCSGNQTTFQKTYGGTTDDYALSVTQSSSGNIAALGETNSFGAGNMDIILVLTDENGDEIETKTYGGANIEQGRHIINTADGGFAILGTTNSFGSGSYDVYFIKTDQDGNVQWSKTYGGSGNDQGRFVQQASDGGYIISAWTFSFGASDRDIYLIKTDASGNVEWTGIYGGSMAEWAGLATQAADGGFIMASTTQSFGSGSAAAYILKTDATGAVDWSKTYGGSGYESTYFIQASSDGGYLLAGYTNSFGAGNYDGYIVKTDASGNLEWSKTYGGASDDRFNAIRPATGGGYIVTGYTESFGSGGRDVLVCKIDDNGNLQWAKTSGGVNFEETTFGEPVKIASDGGYIIAGTTESYGSGGKDIFLLKTNCDGSSGCNEQDVSLTVSDVTSSVSTPTLSLSSGSTTTNPATVTNSIAILDSTLCEDIISPCSGNAITFQKTYGNTQSEYGRSLVSTDDGGYILLGGTSGGGAGNEDIIAIKVDANGEQVWSKTFGGSATDWGVDIARIGLGEYLILGYGYSFGNDDQYYLISIDENGNENWSKTFGGSGPDRIRAAHLTADGKIITIGYTDTYATGATDFFVSKFDATGNVIWSKAIGGAANDFGLYLNEGVNNYIFTGYRRDYASDFEGFIVQTDTAGNIIWSKTYDNNAGNEVIQSIQPTPDSGYVFCGKTNSFGAGGEDVLVTKIDAAGNVQWSHAFGGTGNEGGLYIQNSNDGGYIVQGFTNSFGNGIEDIYLLKLDINGNLEWSKTYGQTGDEWFLLSGKELKTNNLIPLPDGGYALIGSSDSWTTGGDADFYFIKTDCEGNAGCNQTEPATVETIGTLTATDITPVETLGGIVSNITPTILTPVLSDTTLCENIPTDSCSVSASFTFAPDTALCESVVDSITFTNTSTASALATYQWEFGSGASPATSTDENPPPVVYPGPGQYYVKLSVYDTCGVDTFSTFINIYPESPSVEAGNDTAICFDGDSVQIGDAPIALWEYQWSPTAGLSNPDIANPMARPFTTTTYYIYATDPVTGCTSVDSVTVTVANFSIDADKVICTGDTVQLNTSGLTNVTWSPSTYLSNPNIPDPLAYPPATVTYTAIGSHPQCGNDTLFITVSVDTVVAEAGNDIAICFNGDSVQIGDAPIALWDYQWSPTAGLSDPAIANPMAAPAFTTTYYVTATNTATGCITTDSVTVTVANLAFGPDTSICSGDTVQLAATGFTDVSWYPAEFLSDPTSPAPLAYPPVPTVYTLIGTSPQCGTDTFNITVFIRQTAPITITADYEVFGNDVVQLNACCGDSYLWLPGQWLNNNTIPNPVAAPEENITYFVTVTDSAGCRATDSIRVTLDQEIFIPNVFSPNGDGSNELFKIYGKRISEIHLRIFDRWGQVVYEVNSVDEIANIGWDGTYKSKKQPAGHYVWQLAGKFADGSELNYEGKNAGSLLLLR